MQLGVDVAVTLERVDEDRLGAGVADRVGSRGEGHRRAQHPTRAVPRGGEREVEGCRARGERERVSDTHAFGDLGLEGIDVRAERGDPARAQRLEDVGAPRPL
jgi:hypothetical protein